MVDYSKLSDFEINLAVVHIVIGSGGYDWNSDKKEVYLASVDGGEFLPNAYFDPCNNPADAWPIIAENRIAIIPDSAAGEWVAFNEFTLYEGDWMFASDPTHHSNGKNPLRCAMECFLMMQDAKNG